MDVGACNCTRVRTAVAWQGGTADAVAAEEAPNVINGSDHIQGTQSFQSTMGRSMSCCSIVLTPKDNKITNHSASQ